MSEAHDCGGNAAAYALGALTEKELDAFREHLKSCLICQDEVASCSKVGGVLGMAAPQHKPSKALRKRVLSEVRSEARTRTAGSPVKPHRGRSRLMSRRLASAGVTLGILAAAVLVAVQIGSPGNSVQVFAATVGHAQVRLASDGYAELVVHRLLEPRGNRVYEVWLKHSDGRISATKALFSVTSSGDGVVDVPGDLKGVKAVMVTEEPAGGTKVPTTAPVVVTPIT